VGTATDGDRICVLTGYGVAAACRSACLTSGARNSSQCAGPRCSARQHRVGSLRNPNGMCIWLYKAPAKRFPRREFRWMS
jgi:hypothetical protein